MSLQRGPQTDVVLRPLLQRVALEARAAPPQKAKRQQQQPLLTMLMKPALVLAPPPQRAQADLMLMLAALPRPVLRGLVQQLHPDLY